MDSGSQGERICPYARFDDRARQYRARCDDCPAITMDRLRIAPLTLGDAEALQAITDDPVVIDNIIFLTSPFTVDDARALIAGEPDHVFYGAWHRETGDLIGVVG